MAKVTEVGIFESKTSFSELIQRVLAGERFYAPIDDLQEYM
jgi:hypothetical protein